MKVHRTCHSSDRNLAFVVLEVPASWLVLARQLWTVPNFARPMRSVMASIQIATQTFVMLERLDVLKIPPRDLT